MDKNKEDGIISDFIRSIGPWKSSVVIGGGYAPIIYKLYFAGDEKGNPPVGTRDIDSLVPRRIPVVSTKDIAHHLKEAGFKQAYKDLGHPGTESYRKDIRGLEVEIEFLTCANTRGDKQKNVLISGVIAQPLNYLTLSLEENRKFETFSCERGRVVSPGAWIFHKGLTFPMRKSDAKLCKDLYGMWYVASQMGGFSEEAVKELHHLATQRPKWLKKLRGNLLEWMGGASPSDWANLEAQDPYGKLMKPRFERVVKQLTEQSLW